MKKKRMHQTQTEKKDPNVIHINPNESNLRNEMHFSVQLTTRAHIFRDKKKYTRKKKHKNAED